ncbi:MAG: metal-dependent hydrolase [Armatimonas sp.]
MTYRTHLVGGIASLWALTVLPHGTDMLAISCAAAGFGALLPDLDANASKLQSVTIEGIQPFVPVGIAIRQTYTHRGPLHSLAAIGAVTLIGSIPLAIWLGWQVGVALTLGYASHLMLDMCTRSGLPLFYPNPKTVWLLPKKLRIATGSEWEHLYTATLGILSLALLLSRLLLYQWS